jgi:Histidine kinase
MNDRELPPFGRKATVQELHDHAIQRLFGTQLSLLSTLGRVPAPDVRERIRESVAVLDEIIDELRAALHDGAARSDAPVDG